MTNEYLDLILTTLNEEERTPDYADIEQLPNLKGKNFQAAITFLTDKGYVKTWSAEGFPDRLGILAAGRKFIADGGFQMDGNIKNSPIEANRFAEEANNIARTSKNIAVLALVISGITAIGVAIFEYVTK